MNQEKIIKQNLPEKFLKSHQSIEGNNNYTAQGNESVIFQGNDNNVDNSQDIINLTINKINVVENTETQSIPHNCQSLNIKQNLEQHPKIVQLKTSKKVDTLYNGELVYIDLDLFQEVETNNNSQAISVILHISFGECSEEILYRNYRNNKKAYIRFGIKHGKLRLNLQNGIMPIKEREFIKSEQECLKWIINTTGSDKNPCWEFKVNSEKSKVLGGRVIDKKLGYILNILGDCCILCATFEIQVSTNDIEITAQDGVWDDRTSPKVKETKIRAFLKKVLEPKLKEYLSKVELEVEI
jgi:hypothetical protein